MLGAKEEGFKKFKKKAKTKFFSIRKTLNPFQKKKEARAVTDIARVFRGFHQRGRAKMKKRAKVRERRKRVRRRRHRSCIRVQALFRGRLARLRMGNIRGNSAAVMIQKRWRGKAARSSSYEYAMEVHVAKLLQRHWRGRQARLRFKAAMQARRSMNACIIPAQRVARRFLSVRKMERRRERIRYYACLKHSGEVEAMVARRNAMDRTLIERGARARRRIKENPLGVGAAGKKMVVAGKARGALQELFIHLAHLGGKMSERVGTMGFSKLMKDSPGLVDGKLVRGTDCDTLFFKVLAGEEGQKKLDFRMFGNALRRMAQLRYPDLQVRKGRRGGKETARVCSVVGVS